MPRFRALVAVVALLLGAAASPAAAASSECRLTAAHPRPVVLVHGFGTTAERNFRFFVPELKDAGFCVFGLDYGRRGTAPMDASAAELADFVDDVLAATGARQVDLVGHSEGGIMPRWYLKFLGGAAKVHDFVAWAPPSHGTTASGMAHLRYPGWEEQVAPFCGPCPQVMPDSEFVRRLNAGDETPGRVQYTVIASRYDRVVTPTETAFLDGAHNVLLQDVDPTNHTGHLGMAWDALTFRLTLDALTSPSSADIRAQKDRS